MLTQKVQQFCREIKDLSERIILFNSLKKKKMFLNDELVWSSLRICLNDHINTKKRFVDELFCSITQ